MKFIFLFKKEGKRGIKQTLYIIIVIFIQTRLMSGKLEPVFILTKKTLCLALYYIQFSTNIKMYNHKIKTSFLSLELFII